MNLLISTPNTNPSSKAYLYRDGLEVIGLEITESRVVVTFRVPSSGMYLSHPPKRMPDQVWREEYLVGADIHENPILYLDKVVEGKHIPAATVPERIEWMEQEEREP